MNHEAQVLECDAFTAILGRQTGKLMFSPKNTSFYGGCGHCWGLKAD